MTRRACCLDAVGVAAAARYCKAKEVHDANLCGVSSLTNVHRELPLREPALSLAVRGQTGGKSQSRRTTSACSDGCRWLHWISDIVIPIRCSLEPFQCYCRVRLLRTCVTLIASKRRSRRDDSNTPVVGALPTGREMTMWNPSVFVLENQDSSFGIYFSHFKIPPCITGTRAHDAVIRTRSGRNSKTVQKAIGLPQMVFRAYNILLTNDDDPEREIRREGAHYLNKFISYLLSQGQVLEVRHSPKYSGNMVRSCLMKYR